MFAPSHGKYRSIVAFLLPAIGILAVAAACSTTKFTRAWTAPGLRQDPFRTIVTVALTADQNRRIALEDAVAGELRRSAEGLGVESSYTLGDHDIKNIDGARSMLLACKCDAAIIIRITELDRDEVLVPWSTTVAPLFYRTLAGYYTHWQPIVFAPDYMTSHKTVNVEGAVYTIPDGDLVYSTITDQLDPDVPADVARKLGERLAKDLKQHRLIATPPAR